MPSENKRARANGGAQSLARWSSGVDGSLLKKKSKKEVEGSGKRRRRRKSNWCCNETAKTPLDSLRRVANKKTQPITISNPYQISAIN